MDEQDCRPAERSQDIVDRQQTASTRPYVRRGRWRSGRSGAGRLRPVSLGTLIIRRLSLISTEKPSTRRGVSLIGSIPQKPSFVGTPACRTERERAGIPRSAVRRKPRPTDPPLAALKMGSRLSPGRMFRASCPSCFRGDVSARLAR